MRSLYVFAFFFILYQSTFAQPANDACINAITISNVNNFCSAAAAGTTVNATDDVATSGGFGVASCWGGTVNDVWFKFVAIATDVSITINGNQGSPSGGSLNRPQVALYAGTCGGTINELVCGSPPSGQNIIQIYRGGLTVGETYFIRVDGYNTNKGTFQYCVNNYFPVPTAGGDCDGVQGAAVLCGLNPFSVQSTSGTGLIATEMNSAACFEYSPFTGNVESSSTWYKFTFSNNGTFNFVITPSNPNDDIDFAVYRLPNGINNCSGKITVRCEAASCIGPTGLRASSTDTDEPPGCSWPSDNFVSQLNVTAGQSYALAINNFTSTGNGFSITFGGTATIQGPTSIINDSDADDIICPGESITFTDASTPPPSGTLVKWTWNFGVGATPATFIGKNPPVVSYATTGVKTIILTVESDRGCLISSSKTITVTNVPPTVTISASQNPICASTNTTFTAAAVNAGASPVYQWFLNNNPVGSNSNTYSNNTLNNNDQVKVQVTSNATCNSGSQAMSNIIMMTINPSLPLSVSISGTSSVCQGTSTTLTATPINAVANPTYQWFVNGNPVGSNSSTYSSALYSNGDIVTVRLTSSSGCTTNNPATSAGFPMTIKPKPTVVVNSPSICSAQSASLIASGATAYTWTGGLAAVSNPTTPVLTTTTNYTVTGTTNGCTNSAVSTVTVKPKPVIIVNSPSICSGQTAALTASGATTYTWTGGLAGVSNPTTPVLNNSTSYTVTGTTNGCSDSAVATVTVKPNPSITVNSPIICSGQKATLTANGATTYSWTGGLTSVSNPTTPVLTNSTNYSVTGTTNGCIGTAIASVTVNPNPTITVNSPSICSGQSVSLIASGAATYTWTGGLSSVSNPTTPVLTNPTSYTVTGTTNGCSGNAIASVTIKPVKTNSVFKSVCSSETVTIGSQTFSTSGIYTIVLQTSQGCDSIITLDLTVNTVLVPAVSITASKTDLCPGDSAEFTLTSENRGTAPIFQWMINSIIVSHDSLRFSSSSLKNNDSVKVLMKSNLICAAPAIVTSNIVPITVNALTYTLPTVDYCMNDSVIIDLSLTTSPNPAYSIFWTNNSDTLTTSNDLYSVNNKNSTILPFEIRYGNNCFKKDTLNVLVHSLPIINAIVDKPEIRFEQDVQLDVMTTSDLTYNWLPSTAVNINTIRNPSAFVNNSTVFIVTVSDSNNCKVSDTVSVMLVDDCNADFIYVPDAFSPNSDGINDCFKILSPPRLIEYKMLIFNRWGEKVFETFDVNACWNGTYKGAEALTDTYIYLISLKCKNGKSISKKGSVSIVR